MIVCLACYEDRLASVFENAAEYKLFEFDDSGNIYPAGHLSLPSKDPTDRTSAIMACGVSFLVCGAVSCRTRNSIESSGMAVAPFVKGSVDDVLQALKTNTLHTLAMPGCRVGRCGCRRI
ncbi:MAG: dinitrogenase iron-molybdenum cofactor biosynthesis protein [Desulfovibrionaceae bacterium]